MLTSEGFEYAESIAVSYKHEAEQIEHRLKMDKHSIPYDRTSLLLKRYSGSRR